MTLTAFTKVVDPEKAALAAGDVANTLYRLVQFAIREAVATRTLDEILAARDTIDREVRAFVTERAGTLGVEIGEIGVKDVILPGDVRELLNKVVEAERTAKANLIRRQEETAATRSLLNTARLMEDNPLLLRLKELEALEKLVEKVGRIDLHAGAGAGGFDALLQNLYSLRERATRRSRLEPSTEEGMPFGISSLRLRACDSLISCRTSYAVAFPPLDYLRRFSQTRGPLRIFQRSD